MHFNINNNLGKKKEGKNEMAILLIGTSVHIDEIHKKFTAKGRYVIRMRDCKAIANVISRADLDSIIVDFRINNRETVHRCVKAFHNRRISGTEITPIIILSDVEIKLVTIETYTMSHREIIEQI